jgi:tetratricopeptide (TPR) repeat protein
MKLPENRYSFSAKNYKQPSSPGKKILVILAAAAVIGGVLLYFFLPKGKTTAQTTNMSEIEAMYEYWKVKKYDNVIEAGNALLDANPLQRQALALVGFSYFYTALGEYSMENKLELFDNAVIYLRKLRVSGGNPYEAETEYILGKAYFHKGTYYIDLSIEHMQKAIELGYSAEDMYEYLGLAYSEIDRHEEAIEYFQKASENKDSPLLFLTIAQTYYKLNNRKLAEEYLLRTINSTKDLALEEKSRFLLARIYGDAEENMKAIEQYNSILENNPRAADAHYQLGILYNAMNDTIKARAEWRKTLQLDPSHYGARYHYYD